MQAVQAIELLNFQNNLLAKLLSGSSLQEVIQAFSAEIGLPVILTNSSCRVIAYAALNEGGLIQNYIRVSPLSSPKYCRVLTSENQYQGFVLPVEQLHEHLGFLIILSDEAEMEKIFSWADIVLKVCALEVIKQNQLLAHEREYQDAFVFDLLYGNIEANADIIRKGEIWGWNLHLPHCVLVFELDDYEQYSQDSKLMLTLIDIIETEIAKLKQPPIIFRKREEVTVVLTADIAKFQPRRAYIDTLAKRVLSMAEEKLSPRLVRVGSGRTFAQANEIFLSYQEAKVALNLGRIMDIRTKIPFFRDLGLARILYNHDILELTEFYQDTLGKLVHYDTEQSEDMVKTLEKYLLNHCDLKSAADALFLHPNTLRYRLKKIEEILEIDLNDFDKKLDLMAAFKIRHIKKN